MKKLSANDAAAVEARFEQAIAFHQQGDLARAEAIYREILAAAPAHFDALHMLGVIACQRGQPALGVELIGRAIAINDQSAAAYSNRGNALQDLKRWDEALASYARAIELVPDSAQAHSNRGNALKALKRLDEALASYDRALEIMPDDTEAHFYRANVLQKLGRLEAAAASYRRALTFKPDDADAHNNLGNVLGELGRPAEAVASYQKAISFRPDFVEALVNCAPFLLALKQPEAALESCEHALKINPEHVEALNFLSIALLKLRRHEDVVTAYARLLEIQPDYKFAAGNLLQAKLEICDWTGYAETVERIISAVRCGQRAASPFSFVVASASPADQLHCARTYIAYNFPASREPLWTGQHYRHERIRLAYVSADLREHAVAHLMAGLFETHDRQQFETIAISLQPPDASPMGQRVKAAFDRFIDVSRMSDRDAAALMRELEVDIAVDLMGFTAGNRIGIFAHRPAPVQVNYLGYPGSLGATFIDYIVADASVIAQSEISHYEEEVVFLPHCYLPRDAALTHGEAPVDRSAAGLPESGFVFCCFNNAYKFNPTVFAIWMRLLNTLEHSVLWLPEQSPTVTRNLKREAEKNGVDAARIIFAKRTPRVEDHFARLALADLFLDTLPYNAHTTASDALWAGLPVLTCMGATFASRVAGSLLNAVGLPELITHDLADYEALALKLATTPGMLAEIKSRLAGNCHTLFDADRFRRHIEAAYTGMWQRAQDNLPPAGFAVR